MEQNVVNTKMVSNEMVFDEMNSDKMVSDEMVSDEMVSDEMVSDEMVYIKMNSDETVSDEIFTKEVVHIESFEHRKQIIDKFEIVVLKLGAEWCGPCKAIIKEFSQLIDHYNLNRFQLCSEDVDDDFGNYCNNDEENDIQFKIRYLPTIIVYQSGKIIQTFVGKDLEKLKFLLENI